MTSNDPGLSTTHTGMEPGLSTDRVLLEALEELCDESLTQLEQGHAIWRVAQIGKTAVSSLLDVLSTPNPEVRQRAAAALGRIADRRAVPDLLIALTDADARVRRSAAWALGEIADESSVGGLVAALQDDHRLVRQRSAWALGRIGDSASVEGLLLALFDESQQVRMAATRALGETRNRRCVPKLLEALQATTNADIRRVIADALGLLADPRAVPHLLPLLADRRSTFEPGRERNRVCDSAAHALERINTAEAAAALRTWEG